jgi:hypothetical protein
MQQRWSARKRRHVTFEAGANLGQFCHGVGADGVIDDDEVRRLANFKLVVSAIQQARRWQVWRLRTASRRCSGWRISPVAAGGRWVSISRHHAGEQRLVSIARQEHRQFR